MFTTFYEQGTNLRNQASKMANNVNEQGKKIINRQHIGTSSSATISGNNIQDYTFGSMGRKNTPTFSEKEYHSGDEEEFVKNVISQGVYQPSAGEGLEKHLLNTMAYFNPNQKDKQKYDELCKKIPEFSVPLVAGKQVFRGTTLSQEKVEDILDFWDDYTQNKNIDTIMANKEIAHRLLHGFSGEKDKICSVSTVEKVTQFFSKPKNKPPHMSSVSIIMKCDKHKPARGTTFQKNIVPPSFYNATGMTCEHEILLDQTNQYIINNIKVDGYRDKNGNVVINECKLYMTASNETPYQKPETARILDELASRQPSNAEQKDKVPSTTESLSQETRIFEEFLSQQPSNLEQKEKVPSKIERLPQKEPIHYRRRARREADNTDKEKTVMRNHVRQQQALAQHNAQLQQQHNQNMAQIQQQMQQANIATANFMGTSAAPVIGSQSMSDFMANLNQWHSGAMNQFGRR